MRKGQGEHVIKNNISKNFSMIPNALINDDKISDRGRFLFIYIASKPSEWTFHNTQLTNALKYSADTLRKYIKELVYFGWVFKEQQKKINGKFTSNIYHLYEKPLLNSPYRKNSETENIESEKFCHQKNKEHSNIDNTNTENNNKNNFEEKRFKKNERGKPIT